jgi:phage tail sheath protein FI
MDNAWKYQYDRYRDVFVNVPMNGDIAGLCARTDLTNDAWFSPAGLTRGTIKNIVKSSWEPNKAQRDELYQAGVNPITTQQGAGVILFGDKTMQTTPTAFDRINVRRLFIVLEKAIAIAAKAMLFEFNDEFTRSQFVNIVSPFLREVQGRRGLTDFKVVCDSSNNTGQVIDTNNFVGDIFIKPNRSINFIQLNFIAARSDISFSEIGG